MKTDNQVQGCAFYLRCASAESAEKSFESQLENIEHFVLRELKLPVVARYEDIGAANASWTQLLEDAQLKKFSHVVISSFDRISRNVGEATKRMTALTESGVKLEVARSFNLPGMSLSPEFMLELEIILEEFIGMI